MTQLGEASFVEKEEQPPLETGETPVKIRYCIFFDGTLNNRTNVEARKDHESQIDRGRKGNKTYIEFGKEDNSYDNDYSNIAKMEKYIDDAKGYDVTLSSYVAGSGTQNEDSDTLRGKAIGTGEAGIKAKVIWGLDQVIKKIKNKLEGLENPVITKLSIDAFGFSRGAAGARLFIHKAKVLNEIKNELKAQMFKVWSVEVTFAGLYDTVSSHGLSFSNDTRTLNLRSVSAARKTLQLAAAEEYRKNFSLTNILSTGGSGKTVYLPGAHSDVGGGYNDDSTEEMTVNWSYDKTVLEQDRNDLIESGWYRQGEIWIEEAPATPLEAGNGSMPPPLKLKVKRDNISHEYSKIPMHIMAYFAGVEGVSLKQKFFKLEKVIPVLSSLKDRLFSYAKKNNSMASYWQQNEPDSLFLRHDYLHFSASYSDFGMSPRFKDFTRIRKTYDG